MWESHTQVAMEGKKHEEINESGVRQEVASQAERAQMSDHLAVALYKRGGRYCQRFHFLREAKNPIFNTNFNVTIPNLKIMATIKKF